MSLHSIVRDSATANVRAIGCGHPTHKRRFFRKRSDHVGVKICGVKNEVDAIAAIESGADALGFNLYPGSKRFIQWQKEAAWIHELPAEVSRIALVVNATLDEAVELLETDLFDGLQLHAGLDTAAGGDEERLDLRVGRDITVRTEAALRSVQLCFVSCNSG